MSNALSETLSIFGEGVLTDRVDDPLDEFANKVRSARDHYAKIADKTSRDSDQFYLVVVFRSEGSMLGFLKRAKLEDSRYQSGDDIMRLCGLLENQG